MCTGNFQSLKQTSCVERRFRFSTQVLLLENFVEKKLHDSSMFYALEILAKKGPLASMWLAGVMPSKMKRKQVLSADITILVQSVLTPQVALSQRTSAVLLHGAARMWQMQARVLLHDCTHLSAMVLSRATDSLSIDLVRTWEQNILCLVAQ